MKTELQGIWPIECPNCGEKHHINAKDFPFQYVYQEEREMGAETRYEADGVNYCCTKCGKHFFKIVLYEYPELTKNYGVLSDPE